MLSSALLSGLLMISGQNIDFPEVWKKIEGKWSYVGEVKEKPQILPKIKHQMSFIPKEFNAYNSLTWDCLVENNVLMLFPSWLNHKVESNKKATTDRISLSFNTFVKGTIGDKNNLTELIL